MVRLIAQPLIMEELTRLRDPRCPGPEFRQKDEAYCFADGGGGDGHF